MKLTVEVEPEGEWNVPLPAWACASPSRARTRTSNGSASARTRPTPTARRRARRALQAHVAELQTPYLMPQENGTRAGVRWAELTDEHGRGLRIEGPPHFALTVRPWTSEPLAAARHPTDLVPDPDWLWVNADLVQQGLGSASCGPACSRSTSSRPSRRSSRSSSAPFNAPRAAAPDGAAALASLPYGVVVDSVKVSVLL